MCSILISCSLCFQSELYLLLFGWYYFITNISKMKECSGFVFFSTAMKWNVVSSSVGWVFDFVNNSQFWFSKHFKIKQLLVLLGVWINKSELNNPLVPVIENPVINQWSLVCFVKEWAKNQWFCGLLLFN